MERWSLFPILRSRSQSFCKKTHKQRLSKNCILLSSCWETSPSYHVENDDSVFSSTTWVQPLITPARYLLNGYIGHLSVMLHITIEVPSDRRLRIHRLSSGWKVGKRWTWGKCSWQSQQWTIRQPCCRKKRYHVIFVKRRAGTDCILHYKIWRHIPFGYCSQILKS